MSSIRVYPSEIEQLEYEIELSEKSKLTDLFFKFREHDRYICFSLEKAKKFVYSSQITISAGSEFVLLENPGE